MHVPASQRLLGLKVSSGRLEWTLFCMYWGVQLFSMIPIEGRIVFAIYSGAGTSQLVRGTQIFVRLAAKRYMNTSICESLPLWPLFPSPMICMVRIDENNNDNNNNNNNNNHTSAHRIFLLLSVY